jgi:hypothetical protein
MTVRADGEHRIRITMAWIALTILLLVGCVKHAGTEKEAQTTARPTQRAINTASLKELQKRLRYGMTDQEVHQLLSPFEVGGAGNPMTGWWDEDYFDPKRDEVLTAHFTFHRGAAQLSTWSVSQVAKIQDGGAIKHSNGAKSGR